MIDLQTLQMIAGTIAVSILCYWLCILDLKIKKWIDNFEAAAKDRYLKAIAISYLEKKETIEKDNLKL
ncbi:hypothetical protein GIV75_29300 [Pseudomonas sp. PA-3-5D]|uniref:hypothetical protein n=2 Tax=unclassified Pseudomonas TaxID=196821 RepID=UPI001F427470|nr:hypothetical protein [Pseudomonas sp. PA-3-5D]MCF5564931.1 hypothetical protein [Pseudomonas sp. PA-3-5D]